MKIDAVIQPYRRSHTLIVQLGHTPRNPPTIEAKGQHIDAGRRDNQPKTVYFFSGIDETNNIGKSDSAKDGKKGGKRGPSVEQRLDRMTEELKLTDDQKPKVKTVLEDGAKKRQEMFSDSSVPREQRREKMQAIMDDESKKLKAILTPEQNEKWEKMRADFRKNRPSGAPGADGGKKDDTK
jgi:Spy/CpxP family protein refolding chaperone